VFSGISYLSIGCILGYFFGVNIQQSSNLNWKVFTSPAPWAKPISLYIVSFPAIDVLSAFPLNAITLGNNLLVAAYGKSLYDSEVSLSTFLQFI